MRSHDLVMRHQILILSLTLSEFQYFVCHIKYYLKALLLLLVFAVEIVQKHCSALDTVRKLLS